MIVTMCCSVLFFFGQAQKPDGYDTALTAMYKNTVERVSANELKEKLEAGQHIVLLDTREKEEFKVSHLEGAKNVGYARFSIDSVKDIPKDSPIVVYCSLGVRSERIGEQLQQAGFTQVRNLYGGIFEWMYSNGSVIDAKGNETDQVHTYDENWSRWLIKGEKVY